MRLLFVFLACLTGLSCFGEVSLSGKMPEDLMPGMGQVIEAALNNAAAVEEREYAKSEAEGRRIAARSAVKPKFTSSVAFRQERDEGTSGESGFEDRVVYNVLLRQPLYYWGALESEKEIGELQYDMEQLVSDSVKMRLVQSVRSDYMALVVAKQQLARARLDLAEAQKRLDFQLESIRNQSASDASAFPLEVEVDRKALEVLRGESDWDYQLNDLASQTGLEAEALAALIADEIPKFELLEPEALAGLTAYFVRGLEADSDNQRLALDLEVEKRRLQIIDQSLKPRVDAQVGLSSNAIDLDGTRREQSYSYFGLSVGWDIFDGFRKKGRSMEAVSRLARKEKAKENFEEQQLRSFARLLDRMEIERRVLSIEERLLASAQGSVKFFTERVEMGLASESELADKQRNLTNALIKTQAARISYLNALSTLAYELGFDLSVVE